MPVSQFRFLSTGFVFAGALALIASASRAQSTDLPPRGHGGPVRAIVVDGAGRLASAGLDGAVIVWNGSTDQQLRTVRSHASGVNALISPSAGCFVSGGEDGRIRYWCDGEVDPVEIAAGHGGPISSLAVSLDGRILISGGWDRTVRTTLLPVSRSITNPAIERKADLGRVLLEHAAPVTGVAVSADAQAVLSASFDGNVRLSAIATGAQLARLRLPVAVNAMAATSDGHFLLACADGTLREVTGLLEPVRETVLPDGPLNTVAVSSDGRTVATAGMRTPATLIERSSGEVRARILAPGLPVWALAISADGRSLFTGGADGAVRRFDVATGQPSGPAIAPAARIELPDPKDPGATVFRACSVCHGLTSVDTNLAGPTLAGIMGRRIASAPGYVYSEPFKQLSIVWTPETISRLFEIGPAAYTPGTKMPEQRITDPADRKALVEWLARVAKP